jgi:hypothetical protein
VIFFLLHRFASLFQSLFQSALGFSGADGYAYGLQTSTNLVNWEVVSTNHPVQGRFTAPIVSATNSPNGFYRSVLLP